jgi:hypothetical protein
MRDKAANSVFYCNTIPPPLRRISRLKLRRHEATQVNQGPETGTTTAMIAERPRAAVQSLVPLWDGTSRSDRQSRALSVGDEQDHTMERF